MSCLSPNPIRTDRMEDFMFDEIAPDIQLEIVEEEGFSYYSGYLGRKDKKLTKKLSKEQSLPTSKLSDFENFKTSQWIDLRNKAHTGIKVISSL